MNLFKTRQFVDFVNWYRDMQHGAEALLAQISAKNS